MMSTLFNEPLPGDNDVPQTGNASNPSPQTDSITTGDENQLLPAAAEKYLREAGNIEDMPDAKDQQAMDESLNGNE